VAAALALLGGATITISGCGGGGGGNPAGASGGGSTSNGSVTGIVSGNHGHTATITSVQLQAGNGISLNIEGQAGHNHVVSLSSAEIVTIRGGGSVSKDSTDMDLHRHTVTFDGQQPNPGQGY
jgi:hypothetical protein